jgi:hypothetical protein
MTGNALPRSSFHDTKSRSTPCSPTVRVYAIMLCGTVDQGACGNEALPPEFVSKDIKLVPRGNTHTASKDRVMPLEELTEYACTRRRRFWPQKQMTCTALGDQNATKHRAICANEICKRGTSDGLIRVVDSRKIHAPTNTNQNDGSTWLTFDALMR